MFINNPYAKLFDRRRGCTGLRVRVRSVDGNLLRRRDNNHSSSWEEFTYDSLDRLISAGGQEVRYALNGNLLGREEDETMTYGTGDHSYQVMGYSALITPTSLTRSQSISYTSYDRPLQISESSIRPSTSKTARFTYGSGGGRIRGVSLPVWIGKKRAQSILK